MGLLHGIWKISKCCYMQYVQVKGPLSFLCYSSHTGYGSCIMYMTFQYLTVEKHCQKHIVEMHYNQLCTDPISNVLNTWPRPQATPRFRRPESKTTSRTGNGGLTELLSILTESTISGPWCSLACLLPIFLHGCEIKSGSDLGTRLLNTVS